MSAITPAPNYDTRAPSVQACAIVMMVVTTITVVMRFWSRFIAANLEIWWDDWAMLVTLIFSHSFLATLLYWSTVGLGQHSWMIPVSRAATNALLGRIAVVFYSITICMIKISALFLYARLFKTKGRMVIALWITGTAIVIWTIFLVIYPWTFCKPLAKTYNPLIKGYCKAKPQWNLGSTVLNFILDFIVLLLPMPIIWKLQMNMKRRLAYLAAFALGYSSAFLSFARFVIIVPNPLILSGSGGSKDRSWDFVPLLLLSMLEGPLAIVALCGPSINLLVARVVKYKSLNSLFSSRVPLSNHSANYNRSADYNNDSQFGHVKNFRSSRDGSSSTKAFANDDPTDTERYAGTQIPMGSIAMKSDVRVEAFPRSDMR